MSAQNKVQDETQTPTVEVNFSDERWAKVARLHDQLEEGIVNPIVLAEAVGVRPQMVYNYIRAGRIAAVAHNNTQKLVIDRAEAERFASEYLTKKELRAAKVKAELEAE